MNLDIDTCKTSETTEELPMSDESLCNELTLDQLPPELLMRICDFLDARIIHTLKYVCQTFQELLSGDAYFKRRINQRWPKQYPAVSYEPIDWQEVCAQREETLESWRNQEEQMEHFTYSDCLFAPVDVVHLMKDGSLMAAGSRDRYLTILNLSKYDKMREKSKEDMVIYSDCKAHKGWIWSMASQDGLLATGSWDTYIKVWDVEAGVAPVSQFKCKTALLELHMEQNVIIAAGYDSKIHFVDQRTKDIYTRKHHRRPVLCMAADDSYIITGSEDRSVCIYDRRADKVFKRVELETYPLDMSYGNNQLWFGDKNGLLYLMDTSYGTFEVVQSYDVGHQGKLTGVVHTPGAIYTSSTDYSIKILEPSRDPGLIATLTHHKDGVAGISYQNGVLASAGCDSTIGIWRPKTQCL